MTFTVKVRNPDDPDEFVDQPVEPLWERNGLALHAATADPDNLTLSHVQSGLAILLNIDWEPELVEECATAIVALWDWGRSQDELEADPDYPAIKARAGEIFAGFVPNAEAEDVSLDDRNPTEVATPAEGIILCPECAAAGREEHWIEGCSSCGSAPDASGRCSCGACYWPEHDIGAGEHYCELHDWKTIGMVTTSNGMLAIVPPYYAGSLSDWWDRVFLPENEERRAGKRPRTRPQFEEVQLQQKTFSVLNPQGYDDSERAMVFNTPTNGGYDVEARFCDEYGDGHMTICELRIRLHDHEDDHEEAPAA